MHAVSLSYYNWHIWQYLYGSCIPLDTCQYDRPLHRLLDKLLMLFTTKMSETLLILDPINWGSHKCPYNRFGIHLRALTSCINGPFIIYCRGGGDFLFVAKSYTPKWFCWKMSPPPKWCLWKFYASLIHEILNSFLLITLQNNDHH